MVPSARHAMEYKDHLCGISSTGTSVRHTWGRETTPVVTEIMVLSVRHTWRIETTPVVTRDNGTFSKTHMGNRDHPCSDQR